MRIHKKLLINNLLIEFGLMNIGLIIIAGFHSYFQFQWNHFLFYSLFLNMSWFILESKRFYERKEFFDILQNPLANEDSRTLKRLFDVLFSAGIILFVFTWLFPGVALIIKLTSKGSVFFIQERTGMNNRTFRCYKFRSMIVNNLSDTQQAMPNDWRITTFGRFMRRTYIDELPQFFNVLMGQMSVVGPRPHMLLHTKQYSALIDNYMMRHSVKPGITGWAQLNGYCGDTREIWKMIKRVEYDLSYIRNWTLLWDIKIIWRTLIKDKSPDSVVEVRDDSYISVAAS
jgi:putative colanic acid biosysnthesis UDP-glucose lipid carrier transferase